MQIKGYDKQLLISFLTLRAKSVSGRPSYAEGVRSYGEMVQLQFFPVSPVHYTSKLVFPDIFHVNKGCALYTSSLYTQTIMVVGFGENVCLFDFCHTNMGLKITIHTPQKPIFNHNKQFITKGIVYFTLF